MAHLALDGQDVPVARRADDGGVNLRHIVRDPRGERVRRDPNLLERVVGDQHLLPPTPQLEVRHPQAWRMYESSLERENSIEATSTPASPHSGTMSPKSP